MTAAAAASGFAAECRVGRRYRSIAAASVVSSKCGQHHIESQWRRLNSDLLVLHHEAEKGKHFSFIIVDVTYLISGIYTNFCRLLCKKCDVGYYVINRGVAKLMIIG